MSPSPVDFITIVHPEPRHFEAIQALCKKVYPQIKPWSLAQLQSHQAYFRDGQFLAIDTETDQLLGFAFSLIIHWSDYSPQDNWQDFTSGGFFHNHDPKKGKTLYGAEVMVDPEHRGKGIGKRLYQARRELAEKYGLKRIRAGARLRGYSKYADKLSPEEYTRQVVEKKIYDPTVSFQLNEGFVVIDVAKNYSLNDPETLDYAAVIEWLNPKIAKLRDIKKQEESVRAFLKEKKFIPRETPRELRKLVRKITLLIGGVIREYEGQEFYDHIEACRRQLKKARTGNSGPLLADIEARLAKINEADRFRTAHAFSLLLESINMCEAAYRTWRQRQRPKAASLASQIDLIFVLTAHPTEARSAMALSKFRLLMLLLLDGLENNFVFNEEAISSHLRFLWLHPLAKQKTPSVMDEADYIFSLIFAEPLFDFILQHKRGYTLKLRTWVGGDKDGHPGVDHVVMRACFQNSRLHLLNAIEEKLTQVFDDLSALPDAAKKGGELKELSALRSALPQLRTLRPGDGVRVRKWISQFERVKETGSLVKRRHHEVLLIGRITALFPALVFPIELRENAAQITEALGKPSAPIRKMLETLSSLAGKSPPTAYARGLIISHCESAADLTNARKLTAIVREMKTLRVIPLLESKQSLRNAPAILNDWLSQPNNLAGVKKDWAAKFEVMLGYSDSSKEIGVLSSRLLIRRAMNEVQRVLKKNGLIPILFHGAGGSVARGGGSLREQISWWSTAAVALPKLTVQGEMIQRLFATKEILDSQCLHLSNEVRLRPARKEEIKEPPALLKLAASVEQSYRAMVNDSKTLLTMLDATPFNYLDLLAIGSRPAKRRAPGSFSIESLRAIPWVLCWTQTRCLWPSWWGVGTGWEKLTRDEKNELKELVGKDAFFSSFVKGLGFTLAKVDLDVWEVYLRAQANKDAVTHLTNAFREEFHKSVACVHALSDSRNLLWYRPWLGESIRLRAPYIHVLNLLQVKAIQQKNERLLRETLVGIACGMLTTG